MPSNIEAYKSHKAPEGGGLFYKFKDGVPVKVRFPGIPYVFTSEYTNPTTQETNITTRYAWAAWVHDSESAQVVQLPPTGFRAVQALIEDPDWGDPADYDIKIMRSGTGKDTKYSIVPSPKSQVLSAEAKAAVAAIDMAKATKGVSIDQVADASDMPGPSKQEQQDERIGQILDEDVPPEADEKVNLDDIPF